ncbi:MAG: ankyrin repeat domain-containing protein [Candidatus Thiodiazotropha sp. 6PDIVS]
MNKVLVSLLPLLILFTTATVAGAPPKWQSEVISLVSQQRFEEAGDKLKEYCVEGGNSELCLILASAYFDGEAKFGINSKDVIEAYKYTKLACENGSEAGCKAYAGAAEKGELIQHVLYEPGVENRGAQLKEAAKLGLDLNVTTMFSRTLLQEAVSEEKIEAVKLLLENGADVNYRVSDEDLTPLMYAINTGKTALVTLLLENGADASQTLKAAEYLKMDKTEMDACDFASKLENQEMLVLLKCNNMSTAVE